MACLLDPQGNVIFLSQYHTVGRMRHVVDTELSHQAVSRHHAIIEWRNQHWLVTDISTNGTWVDGKRIQSNQHFPIAAGVCLQFGSGFAERFVVIDDSAPRDSLCRHSPNAFDRLPEQFPQHIISLAQYQVLPDLERPELVVYKGHNGWWVEDALNFNGSRMLRDRELLTLGQERWQLRLAEHSEKTTPVGDKQALLEQFRMEFLVSQDEENIRLNVIQANSHFDLKIRNYHYLSLYLARRRICDKQSGIANCEQGWVYIEQVSRDLGLDETTVNVHVHRARKQFASELAHSIDIPHIIERRPLQLRLGEVACRIVKADKLESEFVCSKAATVTCGINL